VVESREGQKIESGRWSSPEEVRLIRLRLGRRPVCDCGTPGHSIIEPVPCGSALVIKDNLCQVLQGQRIQACARRRY
jgi:hypothetical protein